MPELIEPVVPNPSAVTPLRFHQALVSDHARGVVPHLSAIIAEADRIRGVGK